jgi:hypothetical protein
MKNGDGVPFSREFDGTHFIYSFYMDKNGLYISDSYILNPFLQSKALSFSFPIPFRPCRQECRTSSLDAGNKILPLNGTKNKPNRFTADYFSYLCSG